MERGGEAAYHDYLATWRTGMVGEQIATLPAIDLQGTIISLEASKLLGSP